MQLAVGRWIAGEMTDENGDFWVNVDAAYQLLAVNLGFVIRSIVVRIEVGLHRILNSLYQVLILLLQQENGQFQRSFHTYAPVADRALALLKEPGRVRIVQINAMVVIEAEDDAP